MEFNEEALFGLFMDKTTIDESLQLYQKQAISAFEIDETFDKNMYYISATIQENKNYYQVDTAVEKEDISITSYHCSCQDFQKNKLPCKHCGCVFFHLQNIQWKKHIPTEVKTNPIITEVLQNYQEDYSQSTLLLFQHSNVTLEPILVFYNNMICIACCIKQKKHHIIKNIPQFLMDIRHKNVRKYGREEEFMHHIDNFNKKSHPFLHFLLQNAAYLTIIPQPYPDISSIIALDQPDLLDRFMALFSDKELIYYAKENMYRNLLVKNQMPQCAIKIYQENEMYHIQLSKAITFFKGYQYIYMFDNYAIYRSNYEFLKYSYNFLDLLANQNSLSIPLEQLIQLSKTIFPYIQAYIPIEGFQIQSIASYNAEYKLYIDIVKQAIRLYIICCYNGQEYNILSASNATYQNYPRQQEIQQQLAKYVTMINAEKGFAYITSNENIYWFLKEGIHTLRNICTIYASEQIHKIQIKNQISISMGVRIQNQLLHLDLQSDSLSKDEIYYILNAYAQKKSYYRLKNGDFISLQNDDIANIFQQLQSITKQQSQWKEKDLQIPLAHIMNLNQLSITLHYDVSAQQIIDQINRNKQQTYAIDPTILPSLRQYQKEGVCWLHYIASLPFGGILADDMGTGKTIQVIALLLSEKTQGNAMRSLIVCPSSLIFNWQQEFKKFAPNIRTCIIHGSKNKRQESILQMQEFDILITSYEYLKRDIEHYQESAFDYLILDEAQYIKNHTTQNANAVKMINATHRFALTGTPIENCLAELWSIFDFLMPQYLYEYSYFKKYYETPIIRYHDEQVLLELKNKIAPFILRRLKEDVLDELPQKVENTRYIEFDVETRKLYQANLASIQKDLQPLLTENVSVISILSMLTQLRQLCCHPKLVYPNYDGPSAKLDACMQLIESCIQSGKKILLFSQYTSLFPFIEERLKEQMISYYVLKGSTPKQKRQELVDAFNMDNTPIFLISLKAGGTGLNLTSAEVVIHFDLWWNMATQNQATDRAYRMGQKNTVQVFHFIMKDTIEEKIQHLQEMKASLHHTFIDKNEGKITSMSKDEIIALLE